MKILITILLVIGVLIGTFAVLEDICEEYRSSEQVNFSSDELTGDNSGDPAPCGHEGAGGGGAPG